MSMGRGYVGAGGVTSILGDGVAERRVVFLEAIPYLHTEDASYPSSSLLLPRGKYSTLR